MDNKELIQYAIKGIGIKIAEYESKIDKGYNIIDKINRKEKVNTTKSRAEILETIEKYRQKRDELSKKRDDLLFDEMMADEDRKTQTREENIVKVALSSILSKDTENLGVLFLDDVAEILNKLALRPYCERIGKKYYMLTEEDKQIIADMQLDDYITAGEKTIMESVDNE
jgi:polyhydroxyalkanoate synthesis regulator phasin